MTRRAAAASLCATLLLLLTPAMLPGASAAARTGTVTATATDDDAARLPDHLLLSSRSAEEPTTFTGADGRSYTAAPDAVKGRRGELFFGAEIDEACAYGKSFVNTLAPITRIAKAIHGSGRRVVWTLGVAKTSVFPPRIRERRLPHGRCARRGLAEQARVVRQHPDPRYLPLAEALRSSSRPTYYKTDAHWSTVGGAVFARQLAGHLSPRLAKVQRYSYGTEQWQGMLNSMRGVEAPETAMTATPRLRGAVITSRRATPWPGWPHLTYEHAWRTKNAKYAYPGRTVLVGDSFMMFALENLRPLFHNGRWLWYAHVDLDKVIAEIVKADTVVLELYQAFTLGTTITHPSFLRALRRALREG